MPPVGWLHRHLRMSPAFLTRLSPPGLTATQTVRGELRLPIPCKEPATEPLRKLTRASPGRSREPSGPHRVPPGTHRNLRVPPNTSGCSPNASGRSPADHSFMGPAFRGQRRVFRDPKHDLRLAGTTSVVQRRRCSPPSIFGRSRNLRVPPGLLRETH